MLLFEGLGTVTGDLESISDKLHDSATALEAQSYCFETGSFHIALLVLELARPYRAGWL